MASSSGKVGLAWLSKLIGELKKIKSGPRADTSFSPILKKLETAFKKSDTKNINSHIEYFEKILSKSQFTVSEKKAVEDAKQAIIKAKREISTLVTSERGIISAGVKGRNVQADQSTQKANSSKGSLGNTDTNQKEKDDERPPKKGLSSIKSTADSKTKYVHLKEHINMLKEDISRRDFDMGRFETASKGLEDETSAYLLLIRQDCDAMFRKHEALEKQISNLAQCIREDNLSKENFKKPFHGDMKIILDALCNVSTNNKASVADSLPLDDEIYLLQEEINNETYDIEKAKKRMNTTKNTKKKDVLVLIRETLTKRKEIAACTVNEIQHLKEETEKGEYNEEDFKKRKNTTKCKGDIWETMSVIRNELKQRSNSSRELTDIIEEIRKLRLKYPPKDQTKEIPKEPNWKREIALLKEQLENMEQRKLEYSYVEEEISFLYDEINNGTYDNEAAKTRLKNANNNKVKSDLLSIRAKLTEREENMAGTIQEIHCLKEETVRNIYNHMDFEQRRKQSNYETRIWDDLSFIRDNLNECLNSTKELKEITDEVKKLSAKLTVGVQTSRGRPNEQAWKTDIALIKENLSNIEQSNEEEKKSMVDDITKLKQDVEAISAEKDGLLRRISELNEELDYTRNQIDLTLDELCNQSSVKKTSRTIQKNFEEIRRISMEQRKLLDIHGDEKKRMVGDITQLKGELIAIRKEKDDLLLRLSSIASAKLSDNNPNIADLSDRMRPTKIGEKYKEIYDTEWTDAFEILEKKVADEKKLCEVLVRTLEEAEKYCMGIANRQKNRFLVTLLRPDESEDETHELELHPVHSKMINDLRKQVADQSVERVVKRFQVSDQLPVDLQKHKKVKKYINKCVEICWYMSLQTPPVVLGKLNKKKPKFNKDEYTEYTKKGPEIDFVTWPPLLLHETGPLLCKGVAQGRK